MAMGWLEALFAYLQMEQAKKTDQYNREQNDKPPEVLRSDESKWLWDLLSGLYNQNAGTSDFVQRAAMNRMGGPVQEGVKTGSQYGSDVDITGQTSRYSAGMSAQNDELRKLIASRLGAMGDPPGPATPAPTTRPGGGGGGGGGHGRFQRDFQTGGGGDGMGGGGWSEDYHNNPFNVNPNDVHQANVEEAERMRDRERANDGFIPGSISGSASGQGFLGGGEGGPSGSILGTASLLGNPDWEAAFMGAGLSNDLWPSINSGMPTMFSTDPGTFDRYASLDESQMKSAYSNDVNFRKIADETYDWVTNKDNKNILESIGMGALALLSGSPMALIFAALRGFSGILGRWWKNSRQQRKDNEAVAKARPVSMPTNVSSSSGGGNRGGNIVTRPGA